MPALPRFSNLTLVLTEQCNLRCAYCYVPKTARAMPEATALRAADFLLDRAPAGTDLSLSFFGGEPFLERPLLRRVMEHARERAGKRSLRFTTPTNGTLLDDDALALVRDSGLQVALSVDGTAASADRPDASGAGSLERLRPHLPAVRDLKPILRMTVTPDNVAHLCDNVLTLFGWGFARIMHQPALEEAWSPAAVETWTSEHRRLADWLCERHAAREPMPDLLTLEGISKRLDGQRQGSCGAGVTQAAVDLDGRLFGCYRSVYDPRAARLVLGDLDGERVNETLIATYAKLHPSRALPERGSCKSCEAQAGCTCYCPALGYALLGDLRAVSERACALMRPQVAVVAEAKEKMAAAARKRRRRAAGHVAAAALALGLGLGNSACGERPAGKVDDAQVERSHYRDGLVGGVCPVQIEMGSQLDQGVQHDVLGPGLCAYRPDAASDVFGPGICAPGVCPVMFDQGPTPGLCDPKPEDGGIGPGLCPVPGIC